MAIAYTISDNDLNFFARGRLHVVPSDAPNYQQVRSILLSADPDVDVDALIALADVRVALETHSNGALMISGNTVTYKGKSLDGVWVDKILDFFDKDENVSPVFNALDNLMTNPSFDARSRLPIFVERNKMGFLPDGRIVAFKVVRDNYTDVHTGRFDNTVGKVVTMPRQDVNDNPNMTCSAGLHLGALQYLPHFGLYNDNRRVVLCAFWPSDAVAVPVDYDGSKLRVCRYEVIDEVDKAFVKDFVAQNTTTVQMPVRAPVEEVPAYLAAKVGDSVYVENEPYTDDGIYIVDRIDEGSPWRLQIRLNFGTRWVDNDNVIYIEPTTFRQSA